MIHTARLYAFDLILVLCLFYQYTDQSHVTETPCSWGSWLPWECSCCGNSHNTAVNRIRAKCCAGTIECVALRYASMIISKADDYADNGHCMDNCLKEYARYNAHTCTSKATNLDGMAQSNKTVSCGSTCIGSVSTTVTTTSTVYSSSTKSKSISTKANIPILGASLAPVSTAGKVETAMMNKATSLVHRSSTKIYISNTKVKTVMGYPSTPASRADSSLPSSGLVMVIVACRSLLF